MNNLYMDDQEPSLPISYSSSNIANFLGNSSLAKSSIFRDIMTHSLLKVNSCFHETCRDDMFLQSIVDFQ
jgi:hypothetical protein